MKSIYVYGTGSKAIHSIASLALQYQVLGFVDSDESKRGQRLLGLPIVHSSDLPKLEFDEVVIASSYEYEIRNILKDLNYSGTSLDDLTEIKTLNEELKSHQIPYRKQQSAKLPRTPLNHEHISGAKLLTNRVELLSLLPVNRVGAELGVANGDFSVQILETNKPKRLHLIDTWGSERFNDLLFDNVKSLVSKHAKPNQVQIHRALSTAAATDFDDHYFDWIYIDTSHCYQGTKSELELYADKIKAGGVIAGHDYTMGNWDHQFRYGVMEAVHEFCKTHHWKFKYITMDLSEGLSFAIERITT